MTYTVTSLFSGCGGLDLGFLGDFKFLNKTYPKQNFEINFSNDIDKNACLSYSNYFKKSIVCGDIRKLLDSHKFNYSDVVLGGFPCQDFSNAGKRLGFKSSRGTLYQSMCEVISIIQPKLFLAENVKGLLSINEGSAIDQIVSDFKSLGYSVNYKLFKVSDFGVPQKRERVILIGVNKNYPDFNFDSISKTNEKNFAVDALQDLEFLAADKLINHDWSKAKRNNGQGNNNIKADDFAPTMRAEHHGNIEFHWNGTRRLSAREAARIQSFPDDFIFLPSTSSAYKQIGNAVPPVFAWHLGNAVQTYLNGL